MKKGQDEPLGSLGNGGRAGKNKGEGKKNKGATWVIPRGTADPGRRRRANKRLHFAPM